MLQKGVFCLIDFGEAPTAVVWRRGAHGLNGKYLPAGINSSFEASVEQGEAA